MIRIYSITNANGDNSNDDAVRNIPILFSSLLILNANLKIRPIAKIRFIADINSKATVTLIKTLEKAGNWFTVANVKINKKTADPKTPKVILKKSFSK